ncbi:MULTISPECIES: helix-turn-helix domain-containing protein [Lactobacillus]|uniref:Helix-turn-helix domain-containing protein n=1 Tax=Lactobacillus xujianguonis TaxID=2495899 RepID=A0A437ST92_9LACO|nr:MULTISPECIES: helix-turn-helix domain-containing protein [Lactobacillus]RVU70150.1 helix-turn-helix domain-containing protein [Lactobacillus xujianguonis]RVU73368.1 helix-turn-helix domain-containing protein [Lactobacillus xujianguonis]
MVQKLFNPELDRFDIYADVWIPKTVTVKDEKDLIVINHYWRDVKGKLWGDFKYPMENVHCSFDAYRNRKGYVTPAKIKKLRQQLHLFIREFADAVGINPVELAKIENNQRIQTQHQEMLLENVLDNIRKVNRD